MTQRIRLEGKGTVIHQGGTTVKLRRDGEIIVTTDTAKIDVHPDGRVEAHSEKDMDAYTNGTVRVHSPANKIVAKEEPKPGDRMEDGTIYVGISPDTLRPMYTTPSEAPLTMKWKAAMQYAARLHAYGHDDWRVPTEGELNVLFNQRTAIGGFNVTGLDPGGWYWSSTDIDDLAWNQLFSNGIQLWTYKGNHSSLRCVR